MNLTKERTLFIFLVMLIPLAITYYEVFYTPKDSLELYQHFAFADDFHEAQEIVYEEYQGNFTEEEFQLIKDSVDSPSEIKQFTLLKYEDKNILVETSPGTKKLHVLNVKEIPDEEMKAFMDTEDQP
ncbi:hypothetical protein ACQCVK_13535 [Rossellomorea vietnamensis]|uniref:hypothetical protein n=1 Tax=Rossellomorea vietnamensis TaxID=218284 RepID=UPI003CE6C163